MKKVYIKPTIETANVETQHILAGTSGNMTFDDNGNGSGSLYDEDAEGDAW